jgi:hypothetical protein
MISVLKIRLLSKELISIVPLSSLLNKSHLYFCSGIVLMFIKNATKSIFLNMKIPVLRLISICSPLIRLKLILHSVKFKLLLPNSLKNIRKNSTISITFWAKTL